VRVDVRSVDSLPAKRAIDCEKAARWTKTAGVRRVAKARMADMVVIAGEFRSNGCFVFFSFYVD
jgi:hypothetical protein